MPPGCPRGPRRGQPDPAKAIAYYRASTSRQDGSPEVQRQQCAAWAAAHGVQVVASFVDLGVSGATPLAERAGFMAALDALREHRAGILIVAKRCRLARATLQAAMAESLVSRMGGVIRSADGASDADGPEGELMRSLLDAFSAYERALIASRTKAALRAKRQRGERTGSVPIGKRLDDDGVHLVDDEHEAAAIERARHLRATGATLRAIGDRLAAEGYKPRGRAWHPSAVASMLAA